MAITVGQFKIPISEAGIIGELLQNNLINGPIIMRDTFTKTGYSTITLRIGNRYCIRWKDVR